MKNTYLFLITLFAAGYSFGQIDIHLDSDPGTMINGTTINVDADHSGYNIYMHAINNTGSAMDWNFRRTIISSSGASFTDQFCNDQICFNCTGTTWTSQGAVTIADGDSSLMKPVINFSGGGTARIRYYVVDANNGDQPIDSVDFNINSTVGIEDLDITFSSYPNPAADDFYINFEGANGYDFNVVVYNVLGEEVIRRTLVDGQNKLNVTNLNNGVYFYSIVTNNEIIETKKLIVRH